MNRISRKNLDALQADVQATLEDVTTATQAHAKAMDRYIQAHREYRAYVKSVNENIPYVELINEKELEHEGDRYKRVYRKARDGDVVVYLQSTSDGYIVAGKPYKVRQAGGLIISICEDGTECLVYADNVCPPFVYKKIALANELRAEVIQRAKEVLEVWKRNSFVGLGDYQNSELPSPYNHWSMIAEFVINPEKRTVVALLKCRETLRLATSRIAKCSPRDVFNEHIGKAIALGRALGKDVSEFENAVQPTIAVGQKILSNDSGNLLTVQSVTDEGYPANKTGVCFVTDYRIVDDTDAQYGGDE